jgi:hypothetical protein
LHHPRYVAYFDEVTNDEDELVILDNGLAESQQFSDVALLAIASQFEPTELVVPDLMKDAKGSIAKAVSFVNTLQEESDDLPFKGTLAFVAQGEDWMAAYHCATAYLENPTLAPYVSTVMFPRHLVTEQEPHARLQAVYMLNAWLEERRYFSLDIHFLGGSRYFPREVHAAAKSGLVRSMDTSMPYVFAMHGHVVTDGVITAPAHRDGDENYWFWRSENDTYTEVLRYNISKLREWSE